MPDVPAPPADPAATDHDLRKWLVAAVVATGVIVLSFPVFLVRQGLARSPAEPAFTGATRS